MVYEPFRDAEEKILLQIAGMESGTFPPSINWYHLLQLAYQHGLPTQLYLHLNENAPEIPEEVWDHLEKFYHYNQELNCSSISELFRVSKLLESLQVFNVPYQGVVLANNVYRDIDYRSFDFVDFYIKKSDAPQAWEIITQNGYEPITRAPLSDGLEEYRFHNKKKSLNLNLRWNFYYHRFHLNSPVLSDQLREVSIEGRPVLTFTPEDSFLIQCLHNAGHSWSQLSYLQDLKELITHHQLNWSEITDKAQRIGIKRMVDVNLILAQEMLGLEIPDPVSDPVARQVSRVIGEQFFTRNQSQLESLKLTLKMRENIKNGFSDVLSQIFVPSPQELDQINGPRILSPLLKVSRPLVLLNVYWKNRVRPIPGKFEPSTPEVVDKMLKLAEVTPGDMVYDLGCGDGRILIAAARDYGAQGVGIDLDPDRIKEARVRAREEGVLDRVTFLQEDLNHSDISQATVVCLFLRDFFLDKFKDKLERELDPGTRIVTNEYQIKGWKPLKREYVVTNRVYTVYLWEI